MATGINLERGMALPLAALAGFEAPEQEAAFFYGLFLRGYSYQELRQDIEVPQAVQKQWRRHAAHDPHFASVAEKMLTYRRRVLGIFQGLVAANNAVQ